MTRTMYDSIYAESPPTNGDLYAGYVAGRWPSYFSLKSRFPTKKIVSIAVASTQDADVLDVESGDSTPQLAPSWSQRQRSQGRVPTVYCPYSLWQPCKDEFSRQSVPNPNWWIALYDNLADLNVGIINGRRVDLSECVAKQYGGNIQQNYDYNIVRDFWPGIDPPAIANIPTWGPLYDEGDFKVQPLNVQVVTDNNGNGYTDVVTLDPAKVVSVVDNAANPPTSGYLPLPKCGRLNVGGICRIVVEQGPANGRVDLAVWVVS